MNDSEQRNHISPELDQILQQIDRIISLSSGMDSSFNIIEVPDVETLEILEKEIEQRQGEIVHFTLLPTDSKSSNQKEWDYGLFNSVVIVAGYQKSYTKEDTRKIFLNLQSGPLPHLELALDIVFQDVEHLPQCYLVAPKDSEILDDSIRFFDLLHFRRNILFWTLQAPVFVVLPGNKRNVDKMLEALRWSPDLYSIRTALMRWGSRL
ncbi:MAG: hypothetical protein UR28_C0020G0030 [Candidatus Peregrinibacteria bacterium GW2011_GWF2_33_10]|nr:MAG: hypothetical protein UR28_C0020G0030 [Candidatus Peregrinibacteria bacterium GW2011_GWF2_33_10]OGI30853.1 MAG: hypothetical protein A2343_00395 [Candidatus Moranbacteria bacterium RIFOXYB12_FULL_35_8]OGJ45333.1 MAG: hypothetical protein A2272_06280 [Candidatus Peregrinibacteria bacterium RIFOXYA12_FULL_33_12]OGJ45375.1 MAG: hypothetical protein A2263_03860 [Candidatus Peregrinibacteria bacterium RIFOXYA2_FULL_33_21]OGJ50978.1 MAG: hypothetical protein A2307_05455 [Candidatus Peregriniba